MMTRTIPPASSPQIPPGLLATDRKVARLGAYGDELLTADAKSGNVRALTLMRADTSPGQARRFVRTACQDWDMTDAVEDAELLVTELVTNAVKHAARPAVGSDVFELTIVRRAGALVMALHDYDPRLPEIRPLAAPKDAGDFENESAGISGVGLHLWLQIPRAGQLRPDDDDEGGKTIQAVLSTNGGR
jgi:anti-sigma regulatory factor (Ser/Thr protein kinase)